MASSKPSGDKFMTYAVYAGVTVATAVVVWWWWRRGKSTQSRTLIDPDLKYAVPLIDKEIVSHDTRRFRFGLPSTSHVLGLPCGQHIYLSAKIDDKLVVRPYTPVTSDERDRGYFDLVIKVYAANVHPKFPEGGKMSQHLDGMALGQRIDVRGPAGLLTYAGGGSFHIRSSKKEPPREVQARRVGLIAGGTGITPMLQVIRQVLESGDDPTELWLLFANQTPGDILLRDQLEMTATQHSQQFHLWFTVDRVPAGTDWAYSTGFVDADMLRAHMPPGATDPDTLILVCGPPPMVSFACLPNLKQLGYTEQQIFVY